jgi:hypothetical protein
LSSEEQERRYLVETGLRHAWDWFTLHATQRLQAVNFFLLAMAFLSTAYVSALRFPQVAAGVSLLGALFAVLFFRFEMRIQELIKAAENALQPAQQELAEVTHIPALRICQAVEVGKRPFTKYSVVIRSLYLSTAVAFLLGFVYAVERLSALSGSLPALTYRVFIVIGAVASIYCGQRIVARDRSTISWYQYVLATLLVGLGGFVLVVSVIRLPG